MKKKLAIIAGTILLVSAFTFVPAAQSLAISALSIFRVNDTKTIDITITDIEEMMNTFSTIAEKNEENWKEIHENVSIPEQKTHKTEPRELASIYEFQDFEIKLPKDLKQEAPILRATDAQSYDFVLNTDKMNQALTKMGLSEVFSSSYNGKELKVQIPAVVVAQYEDVYLMETQGFYVENTDGILDELWSDFLKVPYLTENIRSQLAEIDLSKRDVYLPVVMGIGRETAIGSKTGYIYSTKDIEQNMPNIAEQMGMDDKNEISSEITNEASSEASVLIWTDKGILYCLAGEKSDSELTKIARSIR